MATIPLTSIPPPPQISHPYLTALWRWSLDVRVVLGACLAYIIAVHAGNLANRRKTNAAAISAPGRRTLFEYLVIAHNLFLCLFSAVTFSQVVPQLIDNFRTRPLREAFCDAGDVWAQKGLATWTWIFYISKYYELLDTFILLKKGKQSSFLQTFHHSGAILSMWLLTASQLFSSWIFVSFNSFIHTIMYAYYALTCFGYAPKWKQFLTSMQIAQFLLGHPISIAYLCIPGCLTDNGAILDIYEGYTITRVNLRRVASVLTAVFVVFLVVLFRDFARRTYAKNPQSATTMAALRGKSKKH